MNRLTWIGQVGYISHEGSAAGKRVPGSPCRGQLACARVSAAFQAAVAAVRAAAAWLYRRAVATVLGLQIHEASAAGAPAGAALDGDISSNRIPAAGD